MKAKASPAAKRSGVRSGSFVPEAVAATSLLPPTRVLARIPRGDVTVLMVGRSCQLVWEQAGVRCSCTSAALDEDPNKPDTTRGS
jgi:hypothetical protein